MGRKSLVDFGNETLASIKRRIKREGVDAVFNWCLPYIMHSTKKELSRVGLTISQEELLSLCWDIFESSSRQFGVFKKRGVSLKAHLYRNCLYGVKNYLAHRAKSMHLVSIDDVKDLVETQEQFFAHDLVLMDILSFRGTLPDNYQVVFEDALFSFSEKRSDHVVRKEKSGMTLPRYQENKKVFQWFIQFFLGRR